MTTSASTERQPRLAIALSGGGFRAALFHLGVLLRIAEAGWLNQVDVISSVSGGSVLGAFASSRWTEILTLGATSDAFRSLVADPFIEIVASRSFLHRWALRTPLVIFRKVNGPFTRTNLAAELYETWFGLRSCSDLPAHPYFILNASNLLSGRAWRFTRDGMGDSRIGYSGWAKSFPLGAAVAASAAFPPVFPPLAVSTAEMTFSGPVYGEPALHVPPFLSLADGGVYDNLGVEVLTKRTQLHNTVLTPAEFLLVSDGGFPPQSRFRASGLPAVGEGLLLYRVDELARDQVGALRRRMLVRQFRSTDDPVRGALIVLGSGLTKLPPAAYATYVEAVGASALIPPDLIARLHRTRTNLNAFSRLEAEALMYHGYTLTDGVLWAYQNEHPTMFRMPHPGAWRIDFTSTTIAEWKRALQR